MTIRCQGVFTAQGIRNLEPHRLGDMKAAHKAGEAVEITFCDDVISELGAKFRYFHVVRDTYSRGSGSTQEEAKLELKFLYGIRQEWQPEYVPPWKRFRFAYMDGRWWCFKSTTLYTNEELDSLIEGSIQACIQSGCDVEELLRGRQ